VGGALGRLVARDAGGVRKWETAYKRYRLWCDNGLWQRIIASLTPEGSEVSL
jgi:hypothetical protein